MPFAISHIHLAYLVSVSFHLNPKLANYLEISFHAMFKVTEDFHHG